MRGQDWITIAVALCGVAFALIITLWERGVVARQERRERGRHDER